MFSFLFDDVATAIDFGRSQVKLVQVRRNSSGIHIERAVVLPSPPLDNSSDSGARLADTVRDLLDSARIRPKNLVISVGAPGYAIHRLDLPNMAHKELDEAVRWNIETMLPFPMDKALIDFRVVPNEPADGKANLHTVLVVAVDRDTVNFYLEVLGRLKLKPLRALVPPLAIMETFKSAYQTKPRETVALVDVGHGGTGLTLLTGGKFRLHRYIPFGGGNFTRYLAEEEQMDEPSAEVRKRKLRSADSVAVPLEELANRIERFFQYFEDLNPTEKVDRILITGGTAAMPGIDKCLADVFREHVRVLEPYGKLKVHYEHPDVDTLVLWAPAFTVAWGMVV